MTCAGLRPRLFSILVAVGLFAAALVSSVRAQESFRVVGVVSPDMLNVRALPDPGATVSGTIPSDANGIVRIGECEVWCLVRYQKLVGWVERRFLEADPNQGPSSKTANLPTNAIEDCNSEDSKRRLDGFTALIKQGSLGGDVLALAHSRRSDAYVQLGNLDQGVEDRIKALELQPNDVSYKQRLAQIYLQRAAIAGTNGKLKEALAAFGAAIRVDPSNANAYAGRSEVFFLQKEVDKGIADLRTAAQLGKEKTHRARLSKAYESRGIEHLLKKNFEHAIPDLSEAIIFDESKAALWLHRGSAHTGKKDLISAIKDYGEAIRLNPEFSEALLRRAEIYYERGEMAKSIMDLNAVVRLETKSVDALLLRAVAREANVQGEDAISDYKSVLQIEPTNKLAKAGLERLKGGPVPRPDASELSDKADRPKADTDRPRIAALPRPDDQKKPNAAKRSSDDLGSKKLGPASHATKCGPQARITWKRVSGWGAIAVGATNCGYSWGFRDKTRAEWRAMDACTKKTINCRIVEYSQ